MQKTWTKESIKSRLENDQFVPVPGKTGVEACLWIEKAILAINERQTHDEQRDLRAKHSNARGFTACDGFLASCAEKFLKQGRHLSPKQISKARRLIVKYTGQLLDVINSKEVPSGNKVLR